jgi:hypothetical protein
MSPKTKGMNGIHLLKWKKPMHSLTGSIFVVSFGLARKQNMFYWSSSIHLFRF